MLGAHRKALQQRPKGWEWSGSPDRTIFATSVWGMKLVKYIKG